MAIHGHSVWRYALAAAKQLGQEDVLTSLNEANALQNAETSWRDEDPFIELCSRLNPPPGGLVGTLVRLRQERKGKQGQPR